MQEKYVSRHEFHISGPMENVVHRTGLRPFSLHHTCVTRGFINALYLHCHPEAELFYMEEGQVVFQIENQTFVLNQGDGIFVPPGLTHSATIAPTDSCSFYAIVFSTDLLEKSLPPYCQNYFVALHRQILDCIYPIVDTSENNRLRALLPQIFTYYERPLTDCELSLTGLLMEVWQELYNLHFGHLLNHSTDSCVKSELQNAMEYMQQSYAEPLTLSQIANYAALSEGHLCRSFKAYTGVPPFTYLNRIRIIKSCEYLSGTDKKITEVAALCGFNNISYFNRVFYKTMQVTPSDYRREGITGSM